MSKPIIKNDHKVSRRALAAAVPRIAALTTPALAAAMPRKAALAKPALTAAMPRKAALATPALAANLKRQLWQCRLNPMTALTTASSGNEF